VDRWTEFINSAKEMDLTVKKQSKQKGLEYLTAFFDELHIMMIV
jgi:hypothetical protein